MYGMGLQKRHIIKHILLQRTSSSLYFRGCFFTWSPKEAYRLPYTPYGQLRLSVEPAETGLYFCQGIVQVCIVWGANLWGAQWRPIGCHVYLIGFYKAPMHKPICLYRTCSGLYFFGCCFIGGALWKPIGCCMGPMAR